MTSGPGKVGTARRWYSLLRRRSFSSYRVVGVEHGVLYAAAMMEVLRVYDVCAEDERQVQVGTVGVHSHPPRTYFDIGATCRMEFRDRARKR